MAVGFSKLQLGQDYSHSAESH